MAELMECNVRTLLEHNHQSKRQRVEPTTLGVGLSTPPSRTAFTWATRATPSVSMGQSFLRRSSSLHLHVIDLDEDDDDDQDRVPSIAPQVEISSRANAIGVSSGLTWTRTSAIGSSSGIAEVNMSRIEVGTTMAGLCMSMARPAVGTVRTGSTKSSMSAVPLKQGQGHKQGQLKQVRRGRLEEPGLV